MKTRGLILIGAGALLTVLLTGCGDDDDAEPAGESAPAPSLTQATPAEEAPSPPATPAPTPAPTTAAPVTTVQPAPEETPPAASLFQNPTEVDITWTCDQLGEGESPEISACSTLDADMRLQGNWLVTMFFRTDDEDRRFVSGTTRFYSSQCEWNQVDPEPYDVEVVDGKVVHEGVLAGSGICDGQLFTYTNTWDEETKVNRTTGVIEDAG